MPSSISDAVIDNQSGDAIVSTSRFPGRALRQASLRSVVMLAAIALSPLLCPASVLAANAPAVNEKYSDLGPAIDDLRNAAGKDRRQIVKANMLLTESEAKTFWPLYDEYRGKMHEVGDREVKMLSDFAANINKMSEDEAERLTKEVLSIGEERREVKEDYVGKMSKVLSARTVARFFQIDNKLDAIAAAEAATRVPLIH
jgi:hypothetical protein